MTTPKTRKKGPQRATAPRSRKTGKKGPARKPAATQRPESAEDLVVFAFRLTKAERDRIHQAAGPARASRFVKAAALAAADADAKAFEAVLAEAAAARK